MVEPRKIHSAIQTIKDQKSFIKNLLIDSLGWKIPEGTTNVEEISYTWTAAELNAEGLDKKIVDGQIRQIQPLEESGKQPWGIFLLEFKNVDTFVSGRGLTGPLRKVLRGLVPKKRQQTNKAVWDRENLLFICTCDYKYYRFAYFKPPKDKGIAPLITFGWEPDIPVRTVCEFNLPSLVWPENIEDAVGWVKKWQTAFDVEKVTKQFYEDYAEIFENVEKLIHRQTNLKNNELRMFTQTLFNRLMFLRFIERKGWLTFRGRNDYLLALFEAGGIGEKSLYQSRIRPLFFEGLAIEGNQISDAIGEVPFLNGGLFEEGNQDKSVKDLGNSTFAPIIGRDGLFYKYNFTVQESTPLDIEVAVDPEMLGKVFEELVTGRHESGSYYTPRPVVSFMCREAIKGYLTSKTKAPAGSIAALVDFHEIRELTESHGKEILDALDDLKAVDPACGSGAYLLGLLQELVVIYRLLYSERLVKDARSLYELKLRIISHNLYGVDIDPFATNIAMLRLWLSLSVEADTPLPLPNLDFKIECGDSLGGPCDSTDLEFHQLRSRSDRLIAMKDDFLLAHGTEKEKIRESITKEELRIVEDLQGIYGHGIVNWRIQFAEVIGKNQGFHIVLANPPYVNMVEMDAIDPTYREQLRQQFQTARGGFDLFVPFMERGIDLLTNAGMFVFITPNKLLGAEYSAQLRDYFVRTMQLISLTDLSNIPIFSASVYPVITIGKKSTHPKHDYDVDVYASSGISLDSVNVHHIHRVPFAVTQLTGNLWSPLIEPETGKLLPALRSSLKLEELADVSGAAAVSEAYEWKKAVMDNGEELFKSNPNRYIPFIVSGNIRRHFHTWSSDTVQYIKHTYHKPVIDIKHKAVSDHRMAQILGTKIIVSGMSKRPTCFYDDKGIAAGKSTIVVIPKRNMNGRFLAGVINSKVMDRIYHVLFGSLSLAGGYLRFGPPQLKVLPIPKASDSDQKEIAELVQKCLDAKGVGCEELENQIDQMVYKLYGLTDDDIAVVEKSEGS